MQINIDKITVVKGKKRTIRFVLTLLSEEGEAYVTLKGCTYDSTRIFQGPRVRTPAGVYWPVVDVSDSIAQQVLRWLQDNEDIQGYLGPQDQYKTREEIAKKKTPELTEGGRLEI